jgi:LPPG:FO 2-phospho-L-lactate transferase
MRPDEQPKPVVLLAGGTGGAKLARGIQDLVGSDLTVIANTGDDVEIHGAYVSPDPDLICFRLADRIDERGWGIEGDTFEYMESVAGTEDAWFSLGDEDRMIGIRRKQLIEGGGTLTQAIVELNNDLGIAATVLPMSDQPVRTEVLSGDRWIGFQEFMVRERAQVPIDDVRYAGAEAAQPSPEVLAAIASARVIVIGPSNPIASIGPILAVCRDDLATAGAPVVAVSPIVSGKVLKGPTREFMTWAGYDTSTAGVAQYYGDLVNGVFDEDTLMDTTEASRALAARVLEFAANP